MPYSEAVIGSSFNKVVDTFEVTVNFMFGDADNYSREVWKFKKEEDVVLFANFLKDLIDSPYQTGSLRYEPHNHPDFAKFTIVERDDLWKEDDSYLYEETAQVEFWPNDVDGWGVGKVEDFNTVYFDESGVPHSVTFK